MKPKINLNRPAVSTEEIMAGKSFNQLMGNYKLLTKPFYKSTWFISASVATVATVAVIATINLNNQNSSDENTTTPLTVTEDSVKNNISFVKYDEDSPCINVPVKGAEKPYNTYVIDANKGGQFTHSSGTLVKIPGNSILDENGNTANGKVEIKYREFHDAVDIFLSGIPMTYDSAGTQSHFQSAGMMEILGYQNGKPVQLAEGKTIEVKMASLHPGTEFNVYKLDTISKNWIYKGKDVVTAPGKDNSKPVLKDTSALLAMHKKKDVDLVKIKSEIQKTEKEIKMLTAEKPVEPKKVNYYKYNFDIDVDKNEFPELAIFKNTRFEVGGENKDFSSEFYKMTWDDAKLTPNKKGVNYKLTLTRGDLKKVFIVYPVYDETNFENAKKLFDEQNKLFTEKLVEKEKQKNELTAEEKATRTRWEKEIAVNRHQMMAELEAEKKPLYDSQKKEDLLYANIGSNLTDYSANFTTYRVLDANSAVTRTFSADGFGVHNCDNPKQLPKGERVIASFSNKFTDQEVKPQFVYLMEQNTNSVFTYTSANYGTFRFDPDNTNFIITTLTDGRIAVFSSKDFANVPKRMREYNFKLHVFNEIPRTEKKVREMLGIADA